VPVAKYFVFVGSALAALLLTVSWCFSEPPPVFADRPQIIASAAIRIKSERKWPEKIEFDTTQPTIVPSAGEAFSVAAAPPAPLQPEDTTGQPRLEALAQLNPDTRLAATRRQAGQIKRGLARTSRSNRVAKVPVANRRARLDADEACCRSGSANHWQASPNAMSRRSAAPSWSTGWLALSQR
jgi:hypothetical protein